MVDWRLQLCMSQWISRIDVLKIIVHAVSDKATGKYNTRMKRDFMIWGVVATICAGFLIVSGNVILQKKMLRSFLLHSYYVVVFVVSGFII